MNTWEKIEAWLDKKILMRNEDLCSSLVSPLVSLFLCQFHSQRCFISYSGIHIEYIYRYIYDVLIYSGISIYRTSKLHVLKISFKSPIKWSFSLFKIWNKNSGLNDPSSLPESIPMAKEQNDPNYMSHKSTIL